MRALDKVRVLTVRVDPRNDAQYLNGGGRRWAAKGHLTGYSNSHGLCFEVTHDDGSLGYYEPSELKLINPETP